MKSPEIPIVVSEAMPKGTIAIVDDDGKVLALAKLAPRAELDEDEPDDRSPNPGPWSIL